MDPAAQEILRQQQDLTQRDSSTLTDAELHQQISQLATQAGQKTALLSMLQGPEAAANMYKQSAQDLKETQDTLAQVQAAHNLTVTPHTVTDPAAQEILQTHAADTAQQLAAQVNPALYGNQPLQYGAEKPYDITPKFLEGTIAAPVLGAVGAGAKGVVQGSTDVLNNIGGSVMSLQDKLGMLNDDKTKVPMSATNPELVNPQIKAFYDRQAQLELQQEQENPGIAAGTGRFGAKAAPAVALTALSAAVPESSGVALPLAARLGAGYLAASSQSVPGEQNKNGLEGAVLNAVLPGAGSAGSAVVKGMSTLAPADLENLLASGLKPTAGQALGGGVLGRAVRGYENGLRDTSEFIGGNEHTLVDQAENALQQIRDVAPIAKADIPAARAAYKEAYSTWEKGLPEGTQIPLNNTMTAISNLREQLTQGLAGTGTDVTAKVLDNMSSLEKSIASTGGKVDPQTIQKTMTQLNKLSAQSSKPELGAMKDYASTVKQSLQQDMMAHAQTTGNPELVSNLQKANQMFQDVKDSTQIHQIVDRGISKKGEVNPQIASKAINAAGIKPLPPISPDRMGVLQQIANNIRAGKIQMVAPPKIRINPSAVGKTAISPLTIPLSYYTRNVMNQPGKFGNATNGILQYLLGASNQQRYQPQ